MTMPTHTTHQRIFELPPPRQRYPVVTRMISDPLFPAQPVPPPAAGAPTPPLPPAEPIMWILSQKHPIVPDMRVVRMFIESTGVAVYGVSTDGSNCLRHTIPLDRTRLVEEAMALDVFVEELATAEAGEPDDDPDDTDDDELDEAPPQPQGPQAAPIAAPPPAQSNEQPEPTDAA